MGECFKLFKLKNIYSIMAVFLYKYFRGTGRTLFVGALCGFFYFFFFAFNAHAAVSMVLPNGSECLTVGQAYVITITSDADHVALYYRTDGIQPTHLDASEIKHPLNQTTWSWTPGSGDISEVGIVWVEGHLNNHNTNGEWDDSDAVFSIRTDCSPAPPTTGGGGSVFSAFPPLPLPPLSLSPTSIRWNFKAPEYNVGEVRLLTKELFTFTEKFREQINVTANTEGFITETGLAPNTQYTDRYLQVSLQGALAEVSNISNPHYTIRTLIEIPNKLEATDISSDKITLKVADQLSNLQDGLTGVFFENIVTSEVSDWQKTSQWTFENLEPDTLYQFQAKARNGDGVESAPSEVLSVLTLLIASSSPTPEPTPTLVPTPTLLPTASPIPASTQAPFEGKLYRAQDDPRVFAVEGGIRRHIPTLDIFSSYGFQWDAVEIIEPSKLEEILEARLYRPLGSPQVWLVGDGQRRHILNPDIFSQHGFSWEEIVEVNEQELNFFNPALLIRAIGSEQVWEIRGQERRWITSPEAFGRLGHDWKKIVNVPHFEVESYKEGASLK